MRRFPSLVSRTGIPYGLVCADETDWQPQTADEGHSVGVVRSAAPVIRNEVEADHTFWWPPLVEHDVFINRPEGRYSGGGVEEAIVVKGQSDERARSRRPGRSPAQRGRSAAESLDAGEHTRTLLARRCRR